jgi:multicomponent Na+:H+ antiporter subunit E
MARPRDTAVARRQKRATCSGYFGVTDLLSISAFFALLAFWLLLSGQYSAFLVAAGIGSAVVVVIVARRMEVVDREGMPVQMMAAVVTYWPWLAIEIVKSAWDVSKRILSPRLPISPTLVRFHPSQKSAIGLTIHANSITLTPGTITVEATPSEFLVHGLTREGAQGVVDSEMDRRVRRLEGSH